LTTLTEDALVFPCFPFEAKRTIKEITLKVEPESMLKIPTVHVAVKLFHERFSLLNDH
jgi:hypothetical protein